jgi:hypothetical protein
MSGQYVPSVSAMSGSVVLDPALPVPIRPIDNDVMLMRNDYPAFNFALSAQTLSDNTLRVRTYEAFFNQTNNVIGGALDLDYVNTGTGPANVSWIQVVYTNIFGGEASFVDATAPGTPLYDALGTADGTFFWDRSQHPEDLGEYYFYADLYVVDHAPGAANITIWQGLSWGWNTLRPAGPGDGPVVPEPMALVLAGIGVVASIGEWLLAGALGEPIVEIAEEQPAVASTGQGRRS